jgi:hypothetical protein
MTEEPRLGAGETVSSPDEMTEAGKSSVVDSPLG